MNLRIPTRQAARLALAAVVMLAVCAGCDETKGQADRPDTIELTLGEGDKAAKLTLEVATTDEEIQRGLMFREELGEHAGMIFVFPDQRKRYFWMKNCKIDLDILYFDASGRIVQIYTMRYPRSEQENEDPPSYPSRYPARFAIELNAGMADKLGLNAGDKPDLPLERIKALAE